MRAGPKSRRKIRLENGQMLLDVFWHARRESVWWRPKLHLKNFFLPLYYFQAVVDAFPNQQQLRKKQGQSAANREGNGANREENPENQGGFRKQGKKTHNQVQNGRFVNPPRIVRTVSKRKSFQTTQLWGTSRLWILLKARTDDAGQGDAYAAGVTFTLI